MTGIINVFKDKDGDLLFTPADKVELGIVAFQVPGKAEEKYGSVEAFMAELTPLSILFGAGLLVDDGVTNFDELAPLTVAEQIALLKPELYTSIEVSDDIISAFKYFTE